MKIVTSIALTAALGASVLCPLIPAGAMCGPHGRIDQVVEVDGDQRVFIYHRNGMEDLILQASIKGDGSDFGMVIPLPAIPDIRKVERVFFDDLFATTRVRQAEWARPGAANEAAGKGMMADNAEAEKVEVIKNDVVGPFETVVLKARAMDALMGWFKDNGYVVKDEEQPLMQSYLDKGWYFVAVKVSIEGKKEKFDGRVQPMGLRFRTDEIILPTKMASIVPNGMAFTIYLLTNARVSLPGFQQQGIASLARPATPQELMARPGLRAVLDKDVLLSPDGAIAALAEAQKTTDVKRYDEFINNRYRGLFISKFNGFFPKDKLAEGDVVFKKENTLDEKIVGELIEQLASPAPATAEVARQILEAGAVEQLPALQKGLSHGDYRVRRTVAEILGVLTDLRSAKALVGALKTETDDFVKTGINRALQSMSGQAIKSHEVEKWEAWLAGLK